MNLFFRKFILHKYSEQISAIGKRPLFLISNDPEFAKTISSVLNKHSDIQIAENDAPFLNHIGNLAYAQYLGPDAELYQSSSKLTSDRLDEFLRKISFKNTFGNNYGFNINPYKRSDAKKLKAKMNTYRWGAWINPNENTFSGLKYLFPDMKAIYLFKDKETDQQYHYLFSNNDCLCIQSDTFSAATSGVLNNICDFLDISLFR